MATQKTTIAKLAAGTKVRCSYDGGVTFNKVPGITAVGDIGEMADTQETTTLEDRARTYIPSLGTPANKAIVGNYLADDADQQKFVDAAKTKQSVMMRIELPTFPKTIGINNVALLGFQINGPTAENVIQFTVNGQASGETMWTTNNDVDLTNIALSALTNSVAVGGTLPLTIKTLPDNATVASGQITYEAINDAMATVDDDGIVTGVAVGDWSVKATDSISGISALFFGRTTAAAAPAPTITAKGNLTATAATAKTFTFAQLFDATNSVASDYTVTATPAYPGVTPSAGGGVEVANTVAAGTAHVKAVHKTSAAVTATADIVIS